MTILISLAGIVLLGLAASMVVGHPFPTTIAVCASVVVFVMFTA